MVHPLPLPSLAASPAGGSGRGTHLPAPPQPGRRTVGRGSEPEPMAAADPPGAGELSQLVSLAARSGGRVWGALCCGVPSGWASARHRGRLAGGSSRTGERRRAGSRRRGAGGRASGAAAPGPLHSVFLWFSPAGGKPAVSAAGEFPSSD